MGMTVTALGGGVLSLAGTDVTSVGGGVLTINSTGLVELGGGVLQLSTTNDTKYPVSGSFVPTMRSYPVTGSSS